MLRALVTFEVYLFSKRLVTKAGAVWHNAWEVAGISLRMLYALVSKNELCRSFVADIGVASDVVLHCAVVLAEAALVVDVGAA